MPWSGHIGDALPVAPLVPEELIRHPYHSLNPGPYDGAGVHSSSGSRGSASLEPLAKEEPVDTQVLPGRAVPTRRWISDPAPALPSNYPVVLLRPPYEERDLRPALPDLGKAVVAPGSIVGVRVSRSQVDVDALRALVRDFAQRSPACPVVVLLQMPAEEEGLAAARLASLRCRAVVRVGPELPAVLRDVLTDPAPLGRDVVDWLRLRPIRLNPNQADLLDRIFTEAPAHSDLTTLLDRHRIPPSTARFRIRKRGLPSPNRWFQAARAIHAALRLQAWPELSIASVARQLRFADHSALAHLLRRSLGVTSHEIRGTLGWEWLLDRWLNSSRTLMR